MNLNKKLIMRNVFLGGHRVWSDCDDAQVYGVK